MSSLIKLLLRALSKLRGTDRERTTISWGGCGGAAASYTAAHAIVAGLHEAMFEKRPSPLRDM